MTSAAVWILSVTLIYSIPPRTTSTSYTLELTSKKKCDDAIIQHERINREKLSGDPRVTSLKGSYICTEK